LSTLFPLHAGRLPPTAVLLSHKQFADQLFLAAESPANKGLEGNEGKYEMYRSRKTGGGMPLGGNHRSQ
jgi:hypothetical protein